MIEPLVAVVIVHWLNVEDTRECLLSIRESAYANQIVIFVNNGSPDFDETAFKNVFPGVLIVHSEVNLGFAGGCNLGIDAALERGAEFVYLLNPDTVVRPDFISALLPAFNDPAVGIAGPTLVRHDNPERVWIAGGVYWPLLGFSFREYPGRAYCEDHIVANVPGTAMLIRREVFEAIGKLPEDYFLYFEDLVFSLKAARAGYQTMLVGQPLVRHKISSTAGERGRDVFTPDKAYYFGRNALLMQKPDIVGRAYVIPGIVGQFWFGLPVYMAFCIATGAMGVIPHYVRGLWDGIGGVTGKRR